MSKVVKRYTFAGLPIAVENPAGSERTWERDGGVPGRTVMRHDYGFIEDQDGKDGDELDCYVGPNPNARFAYVVHQLKRPGYRDHDEDKVFLGFDSEEAARSAFAAHRDDELAAYGGMTSIPIGDFVAKLERRTGSGKIRHELVAGVPRTSTGAITLMLMHIEHRADGWHVLSEDRSKHLGGPYSTKSEAEDRLAQVEAFKHKHGVFQPFENPHELAAMLEARGLYEVAIGRSLAFDTARGSDGQVRASVWDRGMTFGEKVKDGQRSEFSLETFNQFIDNWLKRGERISLCYNHQSAYVAQNGQPAPALAQYDAVAIVQGGEVVRCEKLHASTAMPPSVLELQQRVRALATDLDPRPTPDGMWFFRCEVTPLGQQLLPNFSYISPMFTSSGKDEQGNAQGYTLIDLAATNTAFQAGCVISFERKGSTLMGAIDQRGRELRPGDRVRSLRRGWEGHVSTITEDARNGYSGKVWVEWENHRGDEGEVRGIDVEKLERVTMATDINGRQIRRGDRVRVVTDGSTATVIGDPDDAKVDLSGGGWAHPKKVEVLEARVAFARDARGQSVNPGDEVKVTGMVASQGKTGIIVAASGDFLTVDLDEGRRTNIHASDVERLERSWFSRARARVLEQRARSFDFRRGRRRLLERQRFASIGELSPGDYIKIGYGENLVIGRVDRVDPVRGVDYTPIDIDTFQPMNRGGQISPGSVQKVSESEARSIYREFKREQERRDARGYDRTRRFANVNDFPVDIRYQGLTWYRTGKVGTNLRTGKDAAEYESDDRSYRVWRDIDGNVAPE